MAYLVEGKKFPSRQAEGVVMAAQGRFLDRADRHHAKEILDIIRGNWNALGIKSHHLAESIGVQPIPDTQPRTRYALDANGEWTRLPDALSPEETTAA